MIYSLHPSLSSEYAKKTEAAKLDAECTQPKVAYFCMEFALHEELPIYAGGLGVLAGDYLKSAGDAGRPVVGVGILWQQGYTRQLLGAEGHPIDQYPPLDNCHVRDTGARVRVDLRGRSVVCRVSRVDCYGNAPPLSLGH